MSETNGRTHEPNIRELTAQIDGMVKLYEERDRRYEDRFKAQETAVAAALAAAEKLTAAAFAASKEAILKAENSQTAYNLGHNDLQRKMDQQYTLTLPRAEADARFRGFEEKHDDLKKEVAGLRESRSGAERSRDNTRWLVPIVTTAILGVLGLVFTATLILIRLWK